MPHAYKTTFPFYQAGYRLRHTGKRSHYYKHKWYKAIMRERKRFGSYERFAYCEKWVTDFHFIVTKCERQKNHKNECRAYSQERVDRKSVY